jgi:hypothetical protein
MGNLYLGEVSVQEMVCKTNNAYLFMCNLFNDSVCTSDYIVPNGWMISE